MAPFDPALGRLRIRPVRRNDQGVLREFVTRLSPRTRYLRFLSPVPALPESMLLLITAGDNRRLALVAEVETDTGIQVVALGNAAAIDDNRAEVALVVADDWQRRGIGVALAARVLRAAEARGFDRFLAHALWENRVIRRLLSHVGDILSTTTRYGVSEIWFVAHHGAGMSRSGAGSRSL